MPKNLFYCDNYNTIYIYIVFYKNINFSYIFFTESSKTVECNWRWIFDYGKNKEEIIKYSEKKFHYRLSW